MTKETAMAKRRTLGRTPPYSAKDCPVSSQKSRRRAVPYSSGDINNMK